MFRALSTHRSIPLDTTMHDPTAQQELAELIIATMHDPTAQQELAELIIATIRSGANAAIHVATFALTFALAHGPYSVVEAAACATCVSVLGGLSHCVTPSAPHSERQRILLGTAFVVVPVAVLFTVALSTYSVLGSALIVVCVYTLSVVHVRAALPSGEAGSAPGSAADSAPDSAAEWSTAHLKAMLDKYERTTREELERFDADGLAKYETEIRRIVGDDAYEAALQKAIRAVAEPVA